MAITRSQKFPQPARRVARKSVKSTAAGSAAQSLPSVVNVHVAKTQLSRLLARVEAGEEITIARAGQPFARLVPLAPRVPRVPGRFKGMFALTDEEAMAPLPTEYSGITPGPTDPLNRP